MRWMLCSGRQDDARPDLPSGPVPSDFHLKALMARLVDALEVTSLAVDDLARDLEEGRWQRVPLPPALRRQPTAYERVGPPPVAAGSAADRHGASGVSNRSVAWGCRR
jgi:hypothetical protein